VLKLLKGRAAQVAARYAAFKIQVQQLWKPSGEVLQMWAQQTKKCAYGCSVQNTPGSASDDDATAIGSAGPSAHFCTRLLELVTGNTLKARTWQWHWAVQHLLALFKGHTWHTENILLGSSSSSPFFLLFLLLLLLLLSSLLSWFYSSHHNTLCTF